MTTSHTTQTLWRSTSLLRWVLWVYLMSLTVALVSPLIKPQNMQLLCTSAGMTRLLAVDDAGQPQLAEHGKDCNLCLSAVALPGAVFSPTFQTIGRTSRLNLASQRFLRWKA
ncbi:MAG: DUF2946 domain-containing protein [Brachymonas sp.]|nr:DUF2946 domain-containing protein [Brachymonas sp.]